MGSTRNIDMSSQQTAVKIVKAEDATTEEHQETQAGAVAKPTQKKVRSQKYQAARSQVDKSKKYDAFAAIELAKRLSYSGFDGTLEAHGVLRDTGDSAKLTFPSSTGKTVRVEIASDETITKVEAGTIDFDVLIATPAMMPKLTKLARVLGPKGLMPNPKSGTLTENPEKKKKELEAGSIIVKTEKKAPLIHLSFGKTSMDTKELVANLEAIIKAFKGKLVKLAISASMSPGIKVELPKA